MALVKSEKRLIMKMLSVRGDRMIFAALTGLCCQGMRFSDGREEERVDNTDERRGEKRRELHSVADAFIEVTSFPSKSAFSKQVFLY